MALKRETSVRYSAAFFCIVASRLAAASNPFPDAVAADVVFPPVIGADESAILEWGKYTDNDFNYRIFPGGHFYLRDCEDEVISEVMRLL